MAVLSAKKFYNGWSGTDLEIVEPYIVFTDSVDTSVYSVTHNTFVPAVGSTHADSILYAIQQGGISARRSKDNGLIWNVNVTYTAEAGSTVTGGKLDRLVRFRVTSRITTQAATRCYEYQFGYCGHDSVGPLVQSNQKDLPILNSAYDPYDASDTQEELFNTLLVWTQREQTGFDYVTALDAQGTVNSAATTILGVPIPLKAGLMRKVDPVLVASDAGDTEWQVDYEVEINPSGHDLFILDAGLYAIFNPSTEKREILQSDIYSGSPALTDAEKKKGVKIPQLLDGKGELLGGNAGHHNRYRTKKLSDWNTTLDLLTRQIR